MAIEDPNEIERVLTRRARDKAALQAKRRFIAAAVDRDGQVTVYDRTTHQYRRLWPVDAAEAIGRGLAVLKGAEPSMAPQAPAPDQDQPPAGEAVAPPAGADRTSPGPGAKGKGKSAGSKPEIPAPADRSLPQ